MLSVSSISNRGQSQFTRLPRASRQFTFTLKFNAQMDSLARSRLGKNFYFTFGDVFTPLYKYLYFACDLQNTQFSMSLTDAIKLMLLFQTFFHENAHEKDKNSAR